MTMTPSREPRVVCHLRDSNFHGGPEKQILEHCRVLARSREWRPVIATFRTGGRSSQLAERAKESGLEVWEIDSTGPADFGAARRLARRLRESGSGLLVSHGYKADVIGRLAASRAGAAHLPCLRGFTGENLKVRLYEAAQRFVMRRSRHVAAVSRASGEILRAAGVKGEIWVVENAIEARPVEPAAGFRREMGLADGSRLIVAVGRLSPEKGHAMLLEAFAEARAADAPPAVLALIGDGQERENLERAATRLGVFEHARFAGFRRDAPACMAAADLLVNPSHTEGLPNVILEAFVAGAPVVATDVGGVSQLVRRGRTGLLTPKDDRGALAADLRYALEHPDEMARMARAARRFVRRWFNFERQTRRWIEIYEGVLADRRG